MINNVISDRMGITIEAVLSTTVTTLSGISVRVFFIVGYKEDVSLVNTQ